MFRVILIIMMLHFEFTLLIDVKIRCKYDFSTRVSLFWGNVTSLHSLHITASEIVKITDVKTKKKFHNVNNYTIFFFLKLLYRRVSGIKPTEHTSVGLTLLMASNFEKKHYHDILDILYAKRKKIEFFYLSNQIPFKTGEFSDLVKIIMIYHNFN